MEQILFILGSALAMVIALNLVRSMQVHSRNMYLSAFANYATGFVLAIVYWRWRGGPELWGRPVLIGFLTGVFYPTALLVLMRSMGQRGLAMTNAIASMSQIFPVAVAIILGEQPTAVQVAGILMAVIGG